MDCQRQSIINYLLRQHMIQQKTWISFGNHHFFSGHQGLLGLTRGRGMAEQQRLTWLLSMPVRAQVNRVMHLELTGISYNSGEQNKDMSKSRQERDMKDTYSIHTHLKARNPFSLDNQSLRNIDNGVIAGATVNADTAKDVGQTILQSIAGTKYIKLFIQKEVPGCDTWTEIFCED